MPEGVPSTQKAFRTNEPLMDSLDHDVRNFADSN
jgi:hypothetical protein